MSILRRENIYLKFRGNISQVSERMCLHSAICKASNFWNINGVLPIKPFWAYLSNTGFEIEDNLDQYLKYIWSNIFYCQYWKNIWSNIFLCLLLLCIASRERKLVNSSHQLGSTLDFKQNPNFKFSLKSTNCFGRICIWIGNCKMSFFLTTFLNVMNWRGSICNNHQFWVNLVLTCMHWIRRWS